MINVKIKNVPPPPKTVGELPLASIFQIAEGSENIYIKTSFNCDSICFNTKVVIHMKTEQTVFKVFEDVDITVKG